MNRNSQFSYVCNACGLCCHNKVITLSPYDVMRLARAADLSTREAIERFTIRRGSILKFTAAGDPDRKRFAKASLARLAYVSLIAAVFLIVFRRDGIAVLAGLAVFHLLAALATAVPALKEFRKA